MSVVGDRTPRDGPSDDGEGGTPTPTAAAPGQPVPPGPGPGAGPGPAVVAGPASVLGPALLEAFPQAAVLTGLDGTVAGWNRAAEALFGYRAEEAVGRPSRDLVPARGTAAEATEVWAQLRSGRAWTGEFPMRRRDGSSFTAAVRLVLVRAGGDEAVGVLGLSEDVGADRARARAVAADRDRLDLALAVGDIGVWTWDAVVGAVADPRLRAWTAGRGPADGDRPTAWLELVHPDDRPLLLDAARAALAGGGPARTELRLVRRGGGTQWLDCRGRVERDATGTVVGATVVAADTTARRAALAEADSLRARAEFLAEAAARLGRTDGVDARLAVLAELAVPALAECGAVHLVDGDAGLRPVGVDHAGSGTADTFARLIGRIPVGPGPDRGPRTVARTGEPDLIVDVGPQLVGASAGAADLAGDIEQLGLRSVLCVPLPGPDRPLGVLSLGRTRPGPWEAGDLALAVELGRQAGFSVHGAVLAAGEQAARAESAAIGARLGLLSDLNLTLSSSPDPDVLLRRLARRLVPDLADICLVDLVGGAGGARLVALCAPDPAVAATVGEAEGLVPRWANPASSLAITLRTGSSTLVADCGDAFLDATAPDAAVAALYRRLHPTSSLVVPLTAGREVLGALTLVRTGAPGRAPAPRYGPADVELAREVAGRVALVLDNGRLRAAGAATAEHLRRARLPEITSRPNLRAAARYLPAGAGDGGAWYDLFGLPDGSTGMAVGGVTGHDLRAAAAMGQLRSVVRSHASEGADPADVLDRADRLVEELGMAGPATAFCAQAHRADGWGWRLWYANGGHPPPLVRLPDSTVRALAGATGTPVGVPGDGRRPHAVEGVPFGSTVLLYTDGLLGDGHRPPDEVLGALAGVLATAGPDPEGVLDAVAAAVVDRDRADDVALLVVTLD